MNLLRSIANHGLRIFGTHDLLPIFHEHHFSPQYQKRILFEMSKRGDIQNLGHGLYALPTELLADGPIHAFEIAMYIAKKGAISFRSAMAFYAMTDQIFSSIYLTIPRCAGANLSTKSTYKIEGNNFYITRINLKNYFGIAQVFIGSHPVSITDLERTLLDGLSHPHLCGGFNEVIHGFDLKIRDANEDILFNYVSKIPIVIAKRLGWVLEKLSHFPLLQEKLAKIPMASPQKLNPSGPRRGSIHKRWHVMENLV